MPYLMHIAIDKPFRLRRRVYYFEYKGVRFKLVENDPHKWADVLLTIVDSSDSPGAQLALSRAGEFASALGLANNVGIPVRHIGGPGVRGSMRLRRARCNTFVFPEVPFRGMHIGHSLARIATVSDENQRIGLTLFREAHSANKDLFSFLLYWQILEIRHDAVGWTNKMVRTQPRLRDSIKTYVERLPLKGRRLGEYLQEDCRHAIAHIRRRPGRTPLKFDDDNESGRLWLSAHVAKELATHYIRTELKVEELTYLVRRRGRGFPVYRDASSTRGGGYTVIREPPTRFPIRGLTRP